MRKSLLIAVIPLVAIMLATTASFKTDAALACTKARIGGVTKCLQRGQFCQAALKSQYPRYGFRCASGRLR